MTTIVDSPISQDAAWFIGEDKLLTFTVYVPGTTQAQIDDNTAARQDLTGWTLTWVLRLTRSNPVALLTKSTGTGITTLTQTGGTLGQFNVAIARADTSSMKAGTYAHGAARTNSGAWDVVAEGAAVLRKAAAH